MSATQKELREAYKRGMLRVCQSLPLPSPLDDVALEAEARRAYPPKMVTRPITCDGFLYRVCNGKLQVKRDKGVWFSSAYCDAVTALLSTTLTEEVEEGE